MSGKKCLHVPMPPPAPSVSAEREVQAMLRARREAQRKAAIEETRRTLAAFLERQRWIAEGAVRIGPALEALGGRVKAAVEAMGGSRAGAAPAAQADRDGATAEAGRRAIAAAVAESRRVVGAGVAASNLSGPALAGQVRGLAERFGPWLANDALPYGRRLAALSAEAGTPGAAGSEAERTATAAALRGRLMDLYYDLEEAELGWSLAHGQARAAAAALDAALAQNGRVAAHDRDGNALAVELDVDWWTEGALGRARSALAEAGRVLAGQQARRDPAAQEHLLGRTLPDIEAAIGAAVGEARYRAVMAQARYDLGTAVAETFERLGFTVDAQDYQGGDMRTSFLVGAQDPSDAVVTVVVAQADQPHAVRVDLHSFDANQRPALILQQRLDAMKAAIRAAGVIVADATVRDDQPDANLRDVRRLVAPETAA